jgi:hypothetical protein
VIRVKNSLDDKKIPRLVWLVLTVFVLLGYSLQSVAGNAYYSMLMQAYGTVSKPPVILQNGTNGTSTIYINSTSAKVGVASMSANETQDYVDLLSNVDNSTDIGNHSNFTAQQYGPDSIYDILSEADTGSDVITYDYGSGAGSNKWAYKGETSGVPPSVGPDITGQIEVNYTQIASPDDLRESFGPTSPGTRPFFNFKFTITENSIAQLYLLFEGYPPKAGVNVSLYLWNFTGSAWDIKNSISATGGQDENFTATVIAGITHYIDANDHLYFLVVDDNNKGTFYCDYVKVVVTCSANYELDLEVQWTNVDFDETSEYLCIFGGAMSAENITVEAWNGSAWKNLLTNLSAGWNNVSVSSYLTSSDFTIRFKGGNEAEDISQDSWNIDSTLLHVCTFFETTYDYILRVNNTVTNPWEIRLKKYSDSNIDRFQNCTIYFHNSTDGTSNQIIIENGSYINQTGPWYHLGDSETIYIAMTEQANSAATSYIYAYLEIRTPSTTTYAQYVITFEIA